MQKGVREEKIRRRTWAGAEYLRHSSFLVSAAVNHDRCDVQAGGAAVSPG